MHRWYELFVPGRVCLFGEHSDWAGAFRRINSKVLPGQVIIAGTNQGVYARVRSHESRLIIHSVLNDGTRPEPFDIPMERKELLRHAEAGGFYSYACGVAYQMLTYYRIQGLELDNYRTTLPVKKGLSSSAAFSVLVARAFNRVYDLKLTVRAEMEAAYQGEILTPSRCGRMDQGCAFGEIPVLMTFNGELLQTQRLGIGGPLALLLVDLKGKKDTIRILGDLNRAYPFVTDEQSRRVQEYLGPLNTDIVRRATALIEAGDAPALGRLMSEAQQQFDAHLQAASPQELASPRLHQVLADAQVQALTWGGKGVGSQGDGCAQFVTRGPAERERLIAYLRETYGMDGFPLDLRPPQRVRKAVIPVAGFGTRMFPASKALKKELFPVILPDGTAKPIILCIVEEAVSAGIEEIALIVRPGDETFFTEFFSGPLAPEHYHHLPEHHRQYLQTLQNLGERITCIPQTEQAGFGHAVACARDWVGAEPFLLMLGDHLYLSDSDQPCARQLIEVYEQAGAQRSVIGVYEEEAKRVIHYGTVAGTWQDEECRRAELRAIVEKPDPEYARENLVTPGLGADRFLCVYGQYILSPGVFGVLDRLIAADARERGEIQLTTALEMLRKEEGLLGFRVAGKHYDTGLPLPYLQTLNAVHRHKSPGSSA
jgi:UTP-glucose-1-phosphate uridylyltransferase/mevalonate kinase